MTSRVILIILSLVFNLSVFAQVSISTNKQSCRFEVGEQINFLVTSNQSGNATYTLQYDKYNPIQTGTVYLQAGVAKTISYTANEPTVINCLVNHNGNVGVSSAAVSPFQIQMIEDEPQDFDAFWAGKKAELAAVPIDPQLNYHSNTAYSTTYRINLGQIDNRRIYGYITIPNGGGYYPAVITLPPYGTGTGLTVVEPTFAEQSNTISMSISIHNVEPNQIDNNAYTPNYFLDKDQNYYRYGVLAGIRAIDYLYTRSDVDQSKIGLFGNSQGGGLSMLVAGIDNRVKVCMLTISAFCMHEGYKYGRGSGFPYFLQAATGPPYPQEETLQNVKYYDAVYAAARFKGPVLMSVSYLDDTTAPVSNFAAWNQFTGSNKVMIHSTRLGHVSPSRMWEDRFKLLRRVWPNATANPLWPYGDTTSKGHWVNAGSNINGQANAPINLNGTVEFNEGTNYSWPVSWEKVSGPGNVNFSNANNRSTSATFSSNGTYVLRFRSEDQQTYAGENNFITMEDFVQVTIGGSGSNQQNQTISFNSIPDKLTTDNAFNISATASSGLPVSFSIASGPATISGNTITLTGQEGTVIVRANQIGNINYYPAAQQTQSFLVTAPDTGGGGGGGTCTSTTLLSQNKPANQSSTFSTSGVSGDAYKAVDGNTNGNFWGGSVAACTNSYQPYWQVDLGTSYNIEQIKIWNRTEGNDRLNDFYVMISDNPFSNNLNTAINSSSWSQFTSGQAGTPSNFNLNSSGRYVRIQANGNSYLTIAEVQVYGCNGDGGDNNNCQDSDNDGTCDEDDCFIWNPNLPATPGTPCDDYNPHNLNDVILADGCTCQGSGDSNGGGGNNGCQDSDNDGTCDEDDCFIWNPNLPATPGTPCDDYNPHNFNDVILADGCTCQGSGDSNGGGGNNGCQDSDNDGTCDEDDCFIWNPNLPATPGTPCDDYNPHNFNDVILADGCTCQGSGDSNGGGGNNGCQDSDNDGTCDEDDCFIWNPNLPATPGTPCDDYNPHNFNDVILADGCTCQGSGNSLGGGGNTGCQDSDNDGTCDEDDCFIWNPNLPATPGTPCDDYDPHNFNDVYLADGCTCKGSGSSLGGGGNPVASCSSNGNSTSYEYIEKVKIGSINNLSGNNYGYKNYEYLTTSAAPGEALLLNLIPGFTGSTQTLYWRVWIDFNNDGDFWDYGEYFYQESSNTSLFDYVTIPNNVTAESIKLRVAMKAGSWPEPCESFAYGEVEDYTINITQTSAPRITNNKQVESKFDFTLRPNPVDDFVISEFINKDAGQKITAFNLYNTLGEKIDVETLDYRIEEDQLVLFTNSLKAGYYLLSIATMDQMVTKPFIKIE